MSEKSLTQWAVGLVAVTAVAAIAAPVAPPARSETARELLPDLVQVAPYRVEIVAAGGKSVPRFLLTFASSVENVGDGVLIIEGRRPTRAADTMTARQIVVRADGSRRVVTPVGTLSFVRSPDHSHWHLLRFDEYELRRALDFAVVVRDRKTGFCLGDRYPIEDAVAPAPEFALSRCGPGAPGLLRILQGISPGWGDEYQPELEGQSFDLTGLPAGRYVLVHRVNEDHRLVESDYGNNAASVLLRIRWPEGKSREPSVAVLRTCPATARCLP